MDVQILAISGSLRAVSSNTAVLRAAAILVPSNVKITFYSGLGELPHFNPDIDIEPAPLQVDAFRKQLKQSDGILISSPEYAHGVPGSMKNALDWLVGSGELVEKPVALINTSPRATIALASLTEILTVMSAKIIDKANVTLPIAGTGLDEVGIASHPDMSACLKLVIEELANHITKSKQIK
ncbi:NADPH-dependent FMN reductase [Calothrix sp. NIES-4071]|nr:NADPH-dependent FMN reductase [Calothrix sp. NIES-4071]BAZ63922.1 NADPH-dependent FMN reductase [Calothrix sp. NIES-4105]